MKRGVSKDFIAKRESGRSMLEVLGVLTVMGVLSVAGVAGFKSAMNRHRANELMEFLSRTTALTQAQTLLGNLTESGIQGNIDQLKGSHIATAVMCSSSSSSSDMNIRYAIHVTNIPKGVCQVLMQQVDESGHYAMKNANIYVGSEGCTHGTISCASDETNAISFIFEPDDYVAGEERDCGTSWCSCAESNHCAVYNDCGIVNECADGTMGCLDIDGSRTYSGVACYQNCSKTGGWRCSGNHLIGPCGNVMKDCRTENAVCDYSDSVGYCKACPEECEHGCVYYGSSGDFYCDTQPYCSDNALWKRCEYGDSYYQSIYCDGAGYHDWYSEQCGGKGCYEGSYYAYCDSTPYCEGNVLWKRCEYGDSYGQSRYCDGAGYHDWYSEQCGGRGCYEDSYYGSAYCDMSPYCDGNIAWNFCSQNTCYDGNGRSYYNEYGYGRLTSSSVECERGCYVDSYYGRAYCNTRPYCEGNVLWQMCKYAADSERSRYCNGAGYGEWYSEQCGGKGCYKDSYYGSAYCDSTPYCSGNDLWQRCEYSDSYYRFSYCNGVGYHEWYSEQCGGRNGCYEDSYYGSAYCDMSPYCSGSTLYGYYGSNWYSEYCPRGCYEDSYYGSAYAYCDTAPYCSGNALWKICDSSMGCGNGISAGDWYSEQCGGKGCYEDSYYGSAYCGTRPYCEGNILWQMCTHGSSTYCNGASYGDWYSEHCGGSSCYVDSYYGSAYCRGEAGEGAYSYGYCNSGYATQYYYDSTPTSYFYCPNGCSEDGRQVYCMNNTSPNCSGSYLNEYDGSNWVTEYCPRGCQENVTYGSAYCIEGAYSYGYCNSGYATQYYSDGTPALAFYCPNGCSIRGSQVYCKRDANDTIPYCVGSTLWKMCEYYNSYDQSRYCDGAGYGEWYSGHCPGCYVDSYYRVQCDTRPYCVSSTLWQRCTAESCGSAYGNWYSEQCEWGCSGSYCKSRY